MKEINLLPSHLAFDYKKYIIARLSIFFISLNIIVLICISFINIYTNRYLEEKLAHKKTYLAEVQKINNEFKDYKNQYVKFKNELENLKKDIEYYKKIVVTHRFAYTDSIVFVNTFFNGVWFDSVSYNNGIFKIKGYALSKNEFQKYYSNLESNRYINDIKFFYVKEKNGRYFFSINYKVVFR